MSKKNKEPEDLGVKIGTKREQFLTQIRTKMVQENEDCEKTIDVNNLIIATLDAEIEKEKEKFK